MASRQPSSWFSPYPTGAGVLVAALRSRQFNQAPMKSNVLAICACALLLALTGACVPRSNATPADSTQAIPQAPPIPAGEYADRRARIFDAVADGLLLLHARSAPKEMEQWGFVQNPSFFYFTGLSDLPEAILALDGLRREARLFLPPPPTSFGYPVAGVVPPVGTETAGEVGVTAAMSWEDFGPWVEQRLSEGVTTLYVDEPRRPEATGVPEGFAAVAGSFGLWRSSVEGRFPSARVVGAGESIRDLRWVKSPSEVAVLRANARMTGEALKALGHRMHPGMTQRQGESEVVSSCIDAGAQGPSFWPWVMSGPNARIGGLVAAFFRYEQLDRAMADGELVRVDIGCASGFYGGDVGRTLPVSGRFTEGQAEAWNLLIHGYLAGLEAMEPGVSLDAVRDASSAAIAEAQSGLTTDMGRGAAEAILAGGRGTWHIHGVGVESGEDPGAAFEVGSVLAYEPGFEVDGDAFYLEDMIVITETGHAVLSEGLPYTAEEIEAMMARRAGR